MGLKEEAEKVYADVQECRAGAYQPSYTGDYEIDRFLTEVLNTMASKGHDYTQGNPDRLHNFRTVADSVGIPMEKVWFTYFCKHYSALVTYIKEGGQHESEPIEGRVKDLIVYLLLFYKMLQVRARENEPKHTELRKVLDDRFIHDPKEFKKASEVVVNGVPIDLSAMKRAADIVQRVLTQDETRKNPAADTFKQEPPHLKLNPHIVEIVTPDGKVDVDPIRARELAGLSGAYVNEPVARRGAEIVKQIEQTMRLNHGIGDTARYGPTNYTQECPDPVLDRVVVQPTHPQQLELPFPPDKNDDQ